MEEFLNQRKVPDNILAYFREENESKGIARDQNK